MRYTLFFVLLIVACNPLKSTYQTTETNLTAQKEILQFQEKLSKDYIDPEKSPLKEKASEFKGHEFFPIDMDFRVNATFEATPDEKAFEMATSGSRKPNYKKYGILKFKIKEQPYELAIYQNQGFLNHPLYKNYLFLPFADLTNGVETYGGGRYIDMRIPKSETVVLDFNQAYNPYCAYTDGYSCPIVPKENRLNTEIRAGIMLKYEEEK